MAFSYTDIKNVLEQASKKTGGKFLSFDASYYQAHYSEVRDAGGALLDNSLKNYAGDPLQHYVEIGAAKGYAPNAHFDAAFYKSQYADLAPFSGADLLAHYALFGAYEGRAPTAILKAFDGARYLKDNPDVAAYVNANLADFLGSVTNGAIAHYVLFGATEGRKGFTTSGLYVDNHAPATHDVSLTLNKNLPSLTLKASDFPFADVDSGDSLKAIVISATPDNGVLKLNGASVHSGSNTQVTLQQLNEGKLVFFPPPFGWEGLAAFEFKVLDQADASGTGKMQVAVGNVAPTTQAAQVSVEKNLSYTFKTADFPFSDANGDALGGVQAMSLPGLGSLKLNGASVTVGQTIVPADLAAGKLVYTPDMNYNGQQSFSFQVKDAALNSASADMVLKVGDQTPAMSIKALDPAFYEGSGGGATPVSLEITRSNGTGVTTVEWTVVPGTADSSDFIGDTFGSVTFAAGETSKIIQLQVNKDSNAEADETFSVQLKNPVNATLATSTANETILNDDAVVNSTFQFISKAAQAPEGTAPGNGGSVSYQVLRTGDLQKGGSVKWQVVPTGADPAEPNDFVGATYPSGTLQFAANDSSPKDIVVTFEPDALKGGDETFSVQLSNALNGTVSSQAASIGGTILNDDFSKGSKDGDAFEGDHLYALQLGGNEAGWEHGVTDGGWLL